VLEFIPNWDKSTFPVVDVVVWPAFIPKVPVAEVCAKFILLLKYLFISSTPVGAGIVEDVPTIPTLLKPGVVEFVVSIFWKYLLIYSFSVGLECLKFQ